MPAQISTAPADGLGIVVVIPCRGESHLNSTLDALWRCRRPACAVEVVTVINASQSDPCAVHARNRATRYAAGQWIASHRDPRMAFHLLWMPALPAREAGVGLARRIGMDEAVARFHAAANPEGIIVSLDADCGCEPGYLRSIERHFERNPRTPGCAIHFEHPLAGALDPRLYEGIARYELFLRYYLRGLRYARLPSAHHTLGSCMAVRSVVYQREGGMNRRQGGEDFYFLHKIIRLGGFTDLRATTVIPSPRPSARVPFGTGRAMREWCGGVDRFAMVYAPAVFEDLRALVRVLPALYEDTDDGLQGQTLSSAMRCFLRDQGVVERLTEIRANVASRRAFVRRFHRWFDAFRTFRFVKWAGTEVYPRTPLERAVEMLLACAEPAVAAPLGGCREVSTLLGVLRDKERREIYSVGGC